jgi:hypothetical protein
MEKPEQYNCKKRNLFRVAERILIHPIESRTSFGKGFDRFAGPHLFLGLI